MQGDNSGKSTSKLSDYWRTKTYVKPIEMQNPDYPIFPQPYQVGVDKFGGTWLDYNEVFIVQVAQCNLNCWYCFVDKELRVSDESLGAWFTAQEVIEMWRESGSRVLRVSGGEPTLAREFLHDLILLMPGEDGLLWIDTNLMFDQRLINALKGVTMEEAYNVCFSGCFKGWTANDAWEFCGANLDQQFDAAHALVKHTPFELFFYIPDAMTPGVTSSDIEAFFNRMVEEVDPMAPLRTYVLHVKDYTPTDKSKWVDVRQQVDGLRPIELWQHLCRKTFGPELNWIPNHQVSFINRVAAPLITNR